MPIGVGCMVDSCGECENCLRGEEQYCLKGNVPTYAGVDKYGEPTQGGYSTHIVVTEDFVVRIPDNIGLGGLGHMGVKIAHAMGAEVTVLSQTLSKKEDGLKFGAQRYYATKDPETFKELAGTFDLIINTVSAVINLDAYLGLLKLDGTLVNVGAPGEPLSVNVMSLIGHRRSFAGSMIGGIRETQEMLDFCAEHGIVPNIEVISADQIDEAYERVLASDVRYRFVIDTSTI
nr:NAD(P)-dependent alcohol dehydrogenase [uncultured Trichococcus sp.]